MLKTAGRRHKLKVYLLWYCIFSAHDIFLAKGNSCHLMYEYKVYTWVICRYIIGYYIDVPAYFYSQGMLQFVNLGLCK